MEDALEPWDALNTRYRHDGDAQFLTFIEQFQEARVLAGGESIAKQRMALVAADHLAEVLLFRHIATIGKMIDHTPMFERPRRLGARERERLRSDFSYRVEWALWAGQDSFSWYRFRPLLDDLDAAVFRTAHAYRNRVYHADHHNPAALPLLVHVYLAAVGRAFVKSQPSGVGSSNWPAPRARLRKLGYEPDGASMFPAGTFVPADAAAIIGHLTAGLSAKLGDAAAVLRTDLEMRADWIDSMVRDLEGEMTHERLVTGLVWSEFWDAYGTSDALVALDDRRLDALEQLRALGDARDDAKLAEYRDAEAAYATAIRAAFDQFEPRLDMRLANRIRRRAKRLSSARDLGRLFMRYQVIDDLTDAMERRLDDAAIGWDQYIQEETDRRRGK